MAEKPLKTRAMGRKRHLGKLSRRKKLLFAVIPLLLLLGVVEGVSRLFPYRDKRHTNAGFAVPDPDLIWRLKPYDSGRFKTNELGLYDTPYNGDADIKILLLGDSVSWGDGVPMLLGYPHILEQKLNELGAPTTHEVINAGVPGYSTFQEAIYLKLHGLKLQPDLVVLQFCLNDVVERYQSLAAYGGDNVFLGIDTRVGVPGLYGFFLKHSRAFEHLARHLQSRSRRREEYEVEKLARDKLSAELEEAWRLTLEEIDQIRETTAEHKIPFLLVIAPYRFQLSDPDRLRQPQDRLIAYARAHDVMYVDLLEEFVRAMPYNPLFKDPSHFSRFGHYVAGHFLVNPVSHAFLVGRPSSAPG